MKNLGFEMEAPPAAAKPDNLLLFKLRRQRSLIVGVALPLFLVIGFGAQMLPPWYKASAEVTVESRTPRPPVPGSEGEAPMPFTEDVIGTEMAILGSREIMEQVAGKLNLMADPHYNPWLEPSLPHRVKQRALVLAQKYVQKYLPPDVWPYFASEVNSPEQQWSDTVDAVARNSKFTPVPRSRVITITTSARDAHLAASISNLIGQLYISSHLGLTQEMNVDANTFLTKRLAELQTAATAAGQAVETYRRQNGLSAGATSTLQQEMITQLNRDLIEAQTRLGALQTQHDTMQGVNPESLSIVVNSPTMARLRDTEATASAKLADISSRYGMNSPQAESYVSVLANVRAQIAAEARRAVQSINSDLASAKANVQALTARAAAMKTQLDAMSGSRARLETLEAQSAAAHSLFSAFLNRSEGIDASLLFPSRDVRVISAAAVPTAPAFPQAIYTMPSAAVAAFLLAGLLGLLVESRRDGISSSSEIESLFGLPTLGIIPILKSKLPFQHRDAVENTLNRIYFGLGGKSVLITSALPDEGKTTCAKALAEAAAERGLSVLLVDGDLRSIKPFASGSTERTSGLAELLRGETTPDTVMQTVPSTGLTVMTSGQLRNNPIRLLSLPNAQNILSDLTSRFELVIIDGPPVMVGGDCWMLAQHVDHTVMVVKWESTPVKVIRAALRQLNVRAFGDRPSATTVAGMILNMVDPMRSRKRANDDSAMFAPSVYNYHRNGAQ